MKCSTISTSAFTVSVYQCILNWNSFFFSILSHNCLFYIEWRYCGFGCSITTGTEFISTSFVISNTSTGTTAVFFFLFLILLIKQQKQQIQPNRCAAQNSGSVSPNVSKTHSYSQKSLQHKSRPFLASFSFFFTVSLDFDLFISSSIQVFTVFFLNVFQWHFTFPTLTSLGKYSYGWPSEIND